MENNFLFEAILAVINFLRSTWYWAAKLLSICWGASVAVWARLARASLRDSRLRLKGNQTVGAGG